MSTTNAALRKRGSCVKWLTSVLDAGDYIQGMNERDIPTDGLKARGELETLPGVTPEWSGNTWLPCRANRTDVCSGAV
jgi:hypothetical protein